jgi:hypothetical protein
MSVKIDLRIELQSDECKDRPLEGKLQPEKCKDRSES